MPLSHVTLLVLSYHMYILVVTAVAVRSQLSYSVLRPVCGGDGVHDDVAFTVTAGLGLRDGRV